jgi:hypothetical protein
MKQGFLCLLFTVIFYVAFLSIPVQGQGLGQGPTNEATVSKAYSPMDYASADSDGTDNYMVASGHGTMLYTELNNFQYLKFTDDVQSDDSVVTESISRYFALTERSKFLIQDSLVDQFRFFQYEGKTVSYQVLFKVGTGQILAVRVR